MHPAWALLVVVVVILVVYLLMANNADKAFIESVAVAQAACNKAYASQTEEDFNAAIAAATAAKTARSISLNQYAPALAAGPPIPAEVQTASDQLDNMKCTYHTLDQVAIDAITTATAACAAASTAQTKENIATAKAAKDAAQAAIKAALDQYGGNTEYITAALAYTIENYKYLSCPLGRPVKQVKVTRPANVDQAISIAEFDILDENGVPVPKSKMTFTPINSYWAYGGSNPIRDGSYNSGVWFGFSDLTATGPNPGFVVDIPTTMVSAVALTPRQDWNGRLLGSRVELISPDGSVLATDTVKDSQLVDYPKPVTNENGKQVKWYLVQF